MATFEATINMSPEDVATLKEQGYSLYAFKAVKATGQGQPTVWFQLNKENLLTSTTITWEEQFTGYNTTQQVAPQTVINSSNNVTTDLGDRITIDSNGNLDNTTNGTSGAVTFLNNADQQFTVGISQLIEGQPNVLCAFPILGSQSSRIIEPITKILLLFSTEVIQTQTVITQAMSAGAFIDLTGVESRTVDYSVNTGWSAGGADWLTEVPALSQLSEFLIAN